MLRAGTQERHAAVIGELDVPVPFDPARFVAHLERQRQRPIYLRPFNFGPGSPCGLWIGTADADYIFHETSTTPFHATHIAVHELAHMLLGHDDTDAWDELIALLAPDVDEALIQLILGRSAYGTEREQEAETLASLVLSGAAASWLAIMPLPRHPFGDPPRQCHPVRRSARHLPNDAGSPDRAAHQDERGYLAAHVIAGHHADVLPGNAVVATPGTSLATLERADHDRCFHHRGGLGWKEAR